ncbi:DoxX family protein [Bradyrhizobium sp. ARR65]|uniref:DoxX family protein n=1 Tax=Bradyrhizobium sp. ARR65 TaxID=1040989 RepID=UPI000A00C4E9|nr:DoxX family protein [Bradyrhizobium sp. ARR65]
MSESKALNTNSFAAITRLSFAVVDFLVSSSVARWAPIPLRLMVGYGFAEHGFAKLLRGADNFTGLLHALGLPLPHLLAWLTIITEIAGGICIGIGALVPLVSIPMAIVLLVAIFTVHLPYGFSSIKLQAITPEGAHFGQPGYETDLLYLACILALVLGGSGPFAVDNWLYRRIDAARHATRSAAPHMGS